MIDRHEVRFDRSAVDACLTYLKERTNENLERLVSLAGSKLAYRHYLWSSCLSSPVSPELTIEEFWKEQLKSAVWNKQLEATIEALIEYLMRRREKQWLSEVLNYLPRGHVFNTTVYLIAGYDNIVYGEDIALNLYFKKFHVDQRETVYYLIHEMAHAGYFKYRRMPELGKKATLRDFLSVVKMLTHLEGMGVVSSFRLRVEEHGLADNDYQTLLNETERNARVHDYFATLSELEVQSDRKLRKKDYQLLENMSARPKRLWYIAGGHMALKIEEHYGTAKLGDLVKKGHEEFFKTYRERASE